MDVTLETIRDRLHPEPYPEVTGEAAGIPLLLTRPSPLGVKYALAVLPYQSGPATAQVGRVRRAVDAFTDASFLSGCGLIILFLAPEAAWPAAHATPRPDRHGLRSTIVQGRVWFDPTTGKHRVSRSAWGPLKFGNLQGQATALQDMLNDWAPEPARHGPTTPPRG